MKKNILNIIFSFGAVILVAVLGSIFVSLGSDWFNSLIKPSQWIPNFIIPIVWTIIYTISAFVLYNWLNKGSLPKSVRNLFILNGILNVLWCLLFFTLNLTLIGQIAIILNLIFGIYLLIEIKKYEPIYFYWLFIYPCWLSIATSLNLAMWILN